MRIPVKGFRAASAACWLVLTLLAGAPAGAAGTDKADVRVLIDISGSMRQNDPQNLRRPALRMLSGLLQPGTHAGVWTFARWVNNLVPVAEVDAAWKQRTQSLSEQISSPGQFTNIEEVLDKASQDWLEAAPGHARHLVLLTDGMVDVSKDPRESEASRARILDALLPRLKAAEVKVHTIALSERADHDLMKRLAGDTGGWYQQVAQADALQRVFLRMFEAVGKPDAIPLQDNRFTVDGSISEATVLLFSRPDAAPAVLHAPGGERFTDSDLPSGVAWYRDQGYDLITISAPQKGEWRLEADVDPDNRVMIVTDLKLQTSEIPTHVAVGETTRVEAYLTNKDQVVSRQAFLRLLELRAEAASADGTEPQALNDAGEGADERAGDGRYSMRYGAQRARDEVELLVSVDSPTFMREKRFRLAVHEPLDGGVADAADGPELTLRLNTAVMQPGATLDEAWQEDADGRRTPLQPTEFAPGEWRVLLSDPASPAYARLSGKTRLGNLLERRMGPFVAPGVALPAPPVEEVQAIVPVPPEPAVVPQAPAAEPVPATEPIPATEEPLNDMPAEEDWMMPAVVMGGFNLLLLIGGTAWFFLRRRRAGQTDEADLTGLIDAAAPSEAVAVDMVQEEAA